VKDAADSVPISNVLNILKTQPDMELVNAAAEISDKNQRYSCWYDPNNNCKDDPHELTMIDHLLLSKGKHNNTNIHQQNRDESKYVSKDYRGQYLQWSIIMDMNLHAAHSTVTIGQ
jgi:hypothetical protein